MNFNIFDKIKLTNELNKIKSFVKYDMPNNLTPEFLKLIPDFETRKKIYILYDACSKEQFEDFIKLFKIDREIALKSVELSKIISSDSLGFIEKNVNKIKKMHEMNLDISFCFEYPLPQTTFDDLYDCCIHYGEEIAKNINENNLEFYNSKNILSLENEFVYNNIDELKTIYKLSDIKFSCLLKYYQKNMNKYETIKKIVLSEVNTFSDEIIEFLEKYDFDENLITVLKENNIYEIASLSNKSKAGLNFVKTDIFFNSNEFYSYEKFSEISIDFLRNFYKKTNNIALFKSIVLPKVTKGVLDFYSNINKLKEKFYNYLSEENKYYLDTLLKIKNSNSIANIELLENELELKNFDISKFVSPIKKIESEQFNKKLFIPKENMGYINEDGIRIIEYGPELKDFKMFVHSIGKSDNEYHHDDIVEKLLDDPAAWTTTSSDSEFMSCSLLTENGLKTYSHDIVLGFAEEDFYITAMFNRDGNTPMSENIKKIWFSSALDEYSPEDINFHGMINEFSGNFKRGTYNEICIRRKQMIPKYIVVKINCTDPSIYNETVKKWAKFYDIPVIVLDYEKIKKNALYEIKEKLNIMKNEGINFDVFIEMLQNMDVIKNDENKYNYFEIFDYLINLCENNYENYNEFKKIIEYAHDNLNYWFMDDVRYGYLVGHDNYEKEKQNRETQIKEFYEKLQYLSNKYEIENEVSLNKLGFTAINYIFLSLLFILVIILFYIFI